MAPLPRVSENPEVQSHYLTQLGLTTALFAALRRLWPTLEPDRLQKTYPTFVRGAAAVTGRYSQAAVSLNADFYDAMREQAGLGSRFSVPVIEPLAGPQIEAYLKKATADFLAEAEVETAKIVESIQREADATMQKVVMDAGRNELIAAIEGDREAHGWARVTKPGACAFCLMLATRGPVYLAKQTASFEAHKSCHCTVQPLFGNHYEAPAHVREALALWRDSTSGLSGKAAIRAFRRAVDAQRSTR